MAVISNGTTLINAGALDSGVATGKLTLLSTQTASNSSSISFTSGINSTYDVYVFKFIDIHAGTDQANFTFNGSSDGGSSYGGDMTTTFFRAVHSESDSDTSLSYETDKDLATSSSFQRLTHVQSSDNDGNAAGILILYGPSNTSTIKHFISRTSLMQDGGLAFDSNIAGYFHGTSVVNAVQFKMSSGNFDGIIKMYGVA